MPSTVHQLVPRSSLPLHRRVAGCALAAWLAAAGSAWAEDLPTLVAERGPATAAARDAQGGALKSSSPSDGCSGAQPYGSGYEARCLGAVRDRGVVVALPASGAASAAARKDPAPDWRAAPTRLGRGVVGGGTRGGGGHGGRR
jgi:hypothetical protein